MITTKNLLSLPDSHTLKTACKAMAVLDAIMSQDWVYRYYSYNNEWSENEEFFEMRNGEGDQMLILFREEGTVINGFAHEAPEGNKEELTQHLPEAFHEFIFGEPVYSAGTTFCVWKSGTENWTTGIIADGVDDHSAELLSPLDASPETYIKWATEYFKGSYKETGIPVQVVKQLFNNEPLTKEMVLLVVDELEDWEQLIEDLIEISYPYHINP
jgi:hypothetical protein